MNTSVVLLAAIFLLCPVEAAAGRAPELVLQENVALVASTPSGRVTIHAGRGYDRSYSWDHCTLSAHMQAYRRRWFGSLGIYDPAPSDLILSTLFPWWFKCDGVSRTVVGEGQIHFATQAQAETWLARYAVPAESVWTHDGLLVRWDITKAREQIGVDLWQVCILGHRPTALPGAHDRAISLRPDDAARPARRKCASVTKADIRETQHQWKEFWRDLDEWPSQK